MQQISTRDEKQLLSVKHKEILPYILCFVTRISAKFIGSCLSPKSYFIDPSANAKVTAQMSGKIRVCAVACLRRDRCCLQERAL